MKSFSEKILGNKKKDYLCNTLNIKDMRITIDTVYKTLQVEGEIQIKELKEFMEKFDISDEWKISGFQAITWTSGRTWYDGSITLLDNELTTATRDDTTIIHQQH